MALCYTDLTLCASTCRCILPPTQARIYLDEHNREKTPPTPPEPRPSSGNVSSVSATPPRRRSPTRIMRRLERRRPPALRHLAYTNGGGGNRFAGDSDDDGLRTPPPRPRPFDFTGAPRRKRKQPLLECDEDLPPDYAGDYTPPTPASPIEDYSTPPPPPPPPPPSPVSQIYSPSYVPTSPFPAPSPSYVPTSPVPAPSPAATDSDSGTGSFRATSASPVRYPAASRLRPRMHAHPPLPLRSPPESSVVINDDSDEENRVPPANQPASPCGRDLQRNRRHRHRRRPLTMETDRRRRKARRGLTAGRLDDIRWEYEAIWGRALISPDLDGSDVRHWLYCVKWVCDPEPSWVVFDEGLRADVESYVEHPGLVALCPPIPSGWL